MNSCGLSVVATKMYAKYVNNQQCETPAVNDKINKIGVVNYQLIAPTFVLVDDEDTTFARIVGKICDKRK